MQSITETNYVDMMDIVSEQYSEAPWYWSENKGAKKRPLEEGSYPHAKVPRLAINIRNYPEQEGIETLEPNVIINSIQRTKQVMRANPSSKEQYKPFLEQNRALLLKYGYSLSYIKNLGTVDDIE